MTKEIADIVVPDGYKLVIDDSILIKERIEKEINDLEEIIKHTPIPTDEELIEYGRMFHPYYESIRRLEDLKNSIL